MDTATPPLTQPRPIRTRRRAVWVTNIPTPYRVHLLTAIDRAMIQRQIDLKVFFMATTEPPRLWKIDPREMGFAHQIAPGVHRQTSSGVFHFNPGVVWNVLKSPPDWLIAGGAWWAPTCVASTLAVARSAACKVVLHLEANRYSMRHSTGAIATVRRAVLERADAYAVPGRTAIDTLQEIFGDSRKTFLSLPNLVDETRFGGRVAALRDERVAIRNRYGLSATDLVMLWPARLDERVKGIVRFLDTVKDLVPKRARILIAGEGPDRSKIEEWVAANLPQNVRILGYQPEEAMIELLATADTLLLPSIIDPNPLSVIEGLWAALPILISYRCGNSPEAVDQNRNGWAVDPENSESVRSSFIRLIALSSNELSKMGQVSHSIAEQRFSTERCVQTFLDELERL